MKAETKKAMWFLLGGCAIGMVLLAGSLEVVHATSSTEFCANCHSNHSLAAELASSGHGNNRTGISVNCSDCHIAPGVGNIINKKFNSVLDAMEYVATDNFNTQEWLDVHRQEAAGNALEYISSVNSETCTSCHEKIKKNLPQAMSPMAQKVHDYNNAKPTEQQRECVYCHRGVAHTYNKEWYVSHSKQIH